MDQKRWIIVMLLAVYAIIGAELCRLVRDRIECSAESYYPYYEAAALVSNFTLPAAEKIFTERFCAGDYHGLRCMVGTLWAGFAMTCFRLFPGYQTNKIKYVHAAMHLVTLAIFTYDIYELINLDRSITHSPYNFHGISGKLTLSALYLQFFVAFMIYIYMYEDCKLRYRFAPCHDIFGLWVFVCLVACCIAGRYRSRMDYDEKSHWAPPLIMMGCFSIILIIVVSPFFEWPIVGGY